MTASTHICNIVRHEVNYALMNLDEWVWNTTHSGDYNRKIFDRFPKAYDVYISLARGDTKLWEGNPHG